MSDDDILNPKNRGLGRGLGALFEDDEGVYPQLGEDGQTPGRKRDMVPVELLAPGASQPRLDFDEQALEDLANSIREHGLLQPLLVRVDKTRAGHFEIIAGERRWRASQMAQLHEVPVIILDIDDQQAMQIALIENLQRENLNPLEEAEAYLRLQEEFDYTQDQLSKVIGKSRSHIANMTRLTSLPPAVQAYVREGVLTTGHARALITAKDAEALAKEVVKKGLSVRQTEALAAKDQGREAAPSAKKSSAKYDKGPDTIALEQEMSNILGMRLIIDTKGGQAGAVRIEYKSLDQLDELLQRLSSQNAGGARLMG